MSKKLLLAVGATLSALVAFGGIFAHIVSEDFDDEQKLKLASQWLDEGRWDLASEIAEDLEPKIDPETNSRWQYVTGVSKLQKIKDELDSAEHRRTLLDATDHLNKSREIGFPVGLKGKGYYYLGFSQFHTYRWDEAIESLGHSYKDYPQCRSQSMLMIIQAQLRKPNPDIADAESNLASWESIPGKSASELAQTYLCQAQLAFRQKRFDQCMNWLDKVDSTLQEFGEALYWKSRCNIQLAMTEKEEEPRENLLRLAGASLKKQIYAAETSPVTRRQASYLYGRVLRLQKNLIDATGALSVVRQQNPNSAEAIAASLEEAEILQELNEYDEALATSRQLLRGIKDTEMYNDYWMPLDELRTRLVAIGDEMRKKSEYERAIQLAQQLTIAFTPAYSLRLQAATYIDWANKVQAETKTEHNQLASEAVPLYIKAGDTLERLATVELRSKDYLDIVWSSAECYQKANQIEPANRMLKTYLQYETRTRQPRALIAIGKNYIAAGRWKDSLDPLERCLEYYPNNPSSYEVRLLLARANTELENLDKAIDLLSANLWDYDLSPESPIWKDSSIELGNLVFQRGRLLLAQLKAKPPKNWSEYSASLQKSHSDLLRGIEQLGEAVQRYPNDSRYYFTRYQLADSYRLAAEMPKLISVNQDITDSDRRQQNQQWRRLMEESVNQFHSLLTAIQSAKETDSLAPAILRNCYFGEADALVALGRYDEAIPAYRGAASYYVNQPEALEALVEVAACHRKMGRDKEAQKALRQAEQVLQRIPPELDGKFISSTRGDRKHWQEKLAWMGKQYQ